MSRLHERPRKSPAQEAADERNAQKVERRRALARAAVRSMIGSCGNGRDAVDDRALRCRYVRVALPNRTDSLTPIQNSGSKKAIEPGTHISTPAAA